MKRPFLYIIVFTLFVSGCIWPFSGARKTVTPSVAGDIVSFEVIDADAVSKGGQLYMMPFEAGVDAVAGDVLDRFSLLMVKGLSDGLADGRKFTVLSGDDASKADSVIKGHIEQFKVRGSFQKKATIKVRGDLRMTSTDQVVALIYAQREVLVSGQNVDKEFYNIGVAMASKLSQ